MSTHENGIEKLEENEDHEETEKKEPKRKKARLFSIKEFQVKLISDSSTALIEFLTFCKQEKNQDCILEFLESGGTCMQLLGILERDSSIHANIVLEIIYHIVISVSAKHLQYRSSTYEACQYLLSNFLTLINKILGLSSTTKDRKITLKLLTALVTFSSNLAKDILVHVNLNPGTLELFIKHSEDKDSVRNAFIHFLISFLVDGHFPTITTLLEKKGLLSSIVNGFLYDPADLVSLVLTAMKNHILENPQISKTTKMKLYNTHVVRDLVNLYNWKGPGGIKKKKQEKIIHVDEVEKSQVSQSIHGFLLVLCTSHKFGIIFKDPMLGLGKKHQNSLMLTVLDGLEKPWEHSYASELVIKICGSCPDLTRLIWSNLKAYLEPRPTKHWLNAVTFANQLLTVNPCMEFSLSKLSVHQVAQVIQFLAAPTPILKTIVPNNNFDNSSCIIKFTILGLIKEMLSSIKTYLQAASNWYKDDKLSILRNLLRDHLLRNFPNSGRIFDENWAKIEEDVPPHFANYDALDRLSLIFDIFVLYKELCLPMLDDILRNVPSELFLTLNNFAQDEEERSSKVIIKVTNLYLNLDANLFLPNQDLFTLVLPLVLKNYYKRKDVLSKNALMRLFKLTGIFEGSDIEITIWINSVFALKNLDNSVVEFILTILKSASEKIIDFTVDFNRIKATLQDNSAMDFEDVLELLTGAQIATTKLKQNNLSPLILAALQEQTPNKYVRNYLNTSLINLFHIQTNPTLFISIILQHEALLSKNIYNYITSWQNNIAPLENFKSKIVVLEKISQSILVDGSTAFLDDIEMFNAYPDLKINLIHMVVFYMANLTTLHQLQEKHLNNCLKITKALIRMDTTIEKHFHVILTNPILLQYFEILHKKHENHKIYCTKFVFELIKEFNCNNFEVLLTDIREKLYVSIKKILNKPKKYQPEKCDNLIQVLNTVGLYYKHCMDLFNLLCTLDESNYLNDQGDLSVIYEIVLQVLKIFYSLCKRDKTAQLLTENVIAFLSKYLAYLNGRNLNTSTLTSILHEYFSAFPHSLQYSNFDLFQSVLNRKEYCKESASLASILLSSSEIYLKPLQENLKNICYSKGLILPLLEAAIKQNANSGLLKEFYINLEPVIEKALQKPQKAGIHFDKFHKGVSTIINEFMPVENCVKHTQKIYKYETTEEFHVNLLCTIYEKALRETLEEKYYNNIVITLVHLGMSLLKKKAKTEDDWKKIENVTNRINNFLETHITEKNKSFDQVTQNETFQLYNKFCLKFGLSGNPFLLNIIKTFCTLSLNDEYAELLIDMIISHSDFLEVILNDNKPGKVEVLHLMYILCERCPKIMQKHHISLLLSAYNATWRASDRIILSLLKLYEQAAGQTYFYDFKPFLWGRPAANYYSVRSDVQKALWRQPKMGNIVDILQEHWILNTIKTYPVEATLKPSFSTKIDSTYNIYDYSFILPLFSYLLAPENTVQTYKFCRSGALSLTIAALSSECEETRSAACFVLFRFYYHLDAKQGGKDKLIYLRLIDAVCKGTSVLKDCKMNNFTSIFFSRMALILTQPMHTMYLPLSQYLSAKASPDLSGIPELLTFLHSPDVSYKEYRHFILEIIRDGLRTFQDLKVALKSMAFKLILELFNSNVCETESKILILQILNKACGINKGAKYLCNVHGLASFLYHVVFHLISSEIRLIPLIIKIMNNIIKNTNEFFDSYIFVSILGHIIDNYCDIIDENDLQEFLELTYLLYDKNHTVLQDERLKKMIDITKCCDAEYLFYYGHKSLNNFFINNNSKDKDYYMKLLTIKYVDKKGR